MDHRALVLIVAGQLDPGARAVASTLARSTGSVRVLLVSGPQLASARWSHTISATGRCRTVLSFPETTLDDRELGAVWVRASSLLAPGFHRSAVPDREYARAELHALVVSWLHSLRGRAVNAIDGNGWLGPSWDPRRWLVEAQRVGLPVASTVLATSARLVAGWRGPPFAARCPLDTSRADVAHEILVVGERAFGPLAARHGDGCVRLAAASGCRLLRVGFHADHDGIGVSSVDPNGAPVTREEVDATTGLLLALAAHAPRPEAAS